MGGGAKTLVRQPKTAVFFCKNRRNQAALKVLSIFYHIIHVRLNFFFQVTFCIEQWSSTLFVLQSRGARQKFQSKAKQCKKEAKNGQTNCLKARKKAKFYFRCGDSFVTKNVNYKNITIFSSKLRLNLAWHCTGALLSFELVLLTTASLH